MGRYKLFMSIGLSIMLLLMMVTFLIFKPDAGYVLWMMFVLIIVIVVIAVVYNYIKLKDMANRCNKLPVNYKTAYIDAQEMIGLSAMTSSMKLEIEQAILEIFEHAVIDKRKLTEVTNDDLKQFVNGFVEVGGGNYTFLYLVSYSGMLFVGYLLLMKFYKLIRDGFEMINFKTETLDVGIVVTYALIAFLFFPWLMMIMKKASSEQWRGFKRGLIVLPFIIPFGLFGILIGVDRQSLRIFLDKEIVIFPSPISFILGMIVFIGFALLRKYTQNIQPK